MHGNWFGLKLGERYEIKTLLGKGAMTLVFEAYDHTLHRSVAVKIVNPEFALTHDSGSSVVNEARTVANLSHPHILGVYDQGSQDANGVALVYLVMQLADGGTLADRLKTSTLNLDETDQILQQVCAALDYAHSRGVIHLDLKPHNILFDKHDNALVADFGLAKLLEEATRIKAESGIGTFEYMPPEQLFGQDVGPFSDIYALGVTLYQILTGELPKREWSGHSAVTYLEKPLPAGVRSVIKQATQFAPHLRFRTVEELAQAFASALQPSPPAPLQEQAWLNHPQPGLLQAEEASATTESAYSLDASPSRRRLAFWTVLGTASLVIAAIVFLFTRGRSSPNTPSRQVPLAAASTSPPLPSPTASPTATTPPTKVPTTIPATIPPTYTSTATLSPTPSPSATPTGTPSPTPYIITVWNERLNAYAAPGENFEVLGEIHNGDRLRLLGRLEDSTWWQVDYLGWEGWIRAQPAEAHVDLSKVPVVTPLPLPTIMPTPTASTTPTAETTSRTDDRPALLGPRNPSFDGIKDDIIPDWNWWAYDNYASGESYDPGASFETPLIKQADDPARFINGSTLQIDAAGHLKFKVYIFQTVNVTPGARLRLQVWVGAYSDNGQINVAAGLEPDGGSDCSRAHWSDILLIDQTDDVTRHVAPEISAGPSGKVTICLYAEPLYPAASNAAFFDDVELIPITN